MTKRNNPYRQQLIIIVATLLVLSLTALARKALTGSAMGAQWLEGVSGWAAPPDTTKNKTAKTAIPEVEIDEEVIPDSLLHPRWKVQHTTPVTYDDLEQGSYDLQRPENMQQTVEYNDS